MLRSVVLYHILRLKGIQNIVSEITNFVLDFSLEGPGANFTSPAFLSLFTESSRVVGQYQEKLFEAGLMPKTTEKNPVNDRIYISKENHKNIIDCLMKIGETQPGDVLKLIDGIDNILFNDENHGEILFLDPGRIYVGYQIHGLLFIVNVEEKEGEEKKFYIEIRHRDEEYPKAIKDK